MKAGTSSLQIPGSYRLPQLLQSLHVGRQTLL